MTLNPTNGSVKVAYIATVDMALRYLLLSHMLNIQKAGYQVVAISSPGPGVKVIEEAGIRHISVPMTRRITPFADLVSLWRLYRVLRREKVAIVHAHTFKAGFLGQLAARIARVPVVVRTLHGFDFHDRMHPVRRRLYITLERIAAHCSSLILSVNKEDVEIAAREGICVRNKIQLIGPGGIGVDVKQFDPDRIPRENIARKRVEFVIPDGVQVIGFVGRLAEGKGFLHFLAACQQVLHWLPHTRILIVGGEDLGKPDAVGSSAASDYGIEDQCIFVGWRPKAELPLLYALMDVLVLPSVREGFPLVIMEASGMRTPVVATDVKGCREAVVDQRNGLLGPLGDVNWLADAIKELLTNRQKAKWMGDQGRRIALERFDEQIVFDRIQAEYARLLLRQGLSAPRLQSSPDSVIN